MKHKPPVSIRRNVESYHDPYIDQQSPEEISACRNCGSVYHAGRWNLREQVSDPEVLRQISAETLCPACRKKRDNVPGGVLRITGDFLSSHRDEIMNLIRNEADRAMVVNPLEKVMSLESIPNGIEITTTNEKLAQRIGRALFKAYSGEVVYKFSADTKLARVAWHRGT